LESPIRRLSDAPSPPPKKREIKESEFQFSRVSKFFILHHHWSSLESPIRRSSDAPSPPPKKRV
jgi:hypothetical protein